MSFCMWSWIPAERGYKQLSMSKKKTGRGFEGAISAITERKSLWQAGALIVYYLEDGRK